ncbi:MAG: hypothetical protein P4N60_09780 [Verrucomicrobiae bacterium]|nr:hypothetical protein [Verrucomicrobiae bacterium]
MLLAEISNFSPPEQFAAWLACAAFSLWFLLLVDKVIQRLRGKSPQPPNSQLDSDQRDIKRRVTVLEEWKDGLMQKLDADKTEIMAAGQQREQNLRGEIKSVAGELHDLQSTVANLPNEFMALLANARNVLGHLE